jgi:hypothetical protein
MLLTKFPVTDVGGITTMPVHRHLTAESIKFVVFKVAFPNVTTVRPEAYFATNSI